MEKRLFFLLILILCIHSCRNDYLINNNEDEINSHLISKTISINQSKHKEKLIPRLNEITKELTNRIKYSGKSFSSGDSISIDTDHIFYIENKDYYNYTFNIKRNNPEQGNPIENILITPLPDGTYKEILISYYVNEEERQNIMSGKSNYVEPSRIKFEVLQNNTISNRGACSFIVTVSSRACSANQHFNGNTDGCDAPVKSMMIIDFLVSCEEGSGTVVFTGWGSSGNPNNPGGSGPGAPGYWHCPEPQIPSGPLDPIEDTGTGDCVFIPTNPNPGTPPTPCEKTMTLMDNLFIKEAVQNLKEHITSGTGGERGWKFNKTGLPTATTENSDHSVNFGDPSLIDGGYHNHTNLGAKIFSATDIKTLINIARYNGVGDPTNAFMGVIIPGDMHYVIRFEGSQTDLPPHGSFSEQQIDDLNKKQWSQYQDLILKPNMTMNEKFEKIFFDTTAKMGLGNKIILQKIDDANNKVYTIHKNPNGTTTPVPCN